MQKKLIIRAVNVIFVLLNFNFVIIFAISVTEQIIQI